MLVEIDGKDNLLREIESKALLNTNSNEINRYNNQKALLEKNKNALDKIDSLEKQMESMKNMLSIILNKLG